MRRPNGGRLLQIEKPIPLSCSRRTAAIGPVGQPLVVRDEGAVDVADDQREPPHRRPAGRAWVMISIAAFRRDDDGGAAADKQAVLDHPDSQVDRRARSPARW